MTAKLSGSRKRTFPDLWKSPGRSCTSGMKVAADYTMHPLATPLLCLYLTPHFCALVRRLHDRLTKHLTACSYKRHAVLSSRIHCEMRSQLAPVHQKRGFFNKISAGSCSRQSPCIKPVQARAAVKASAMPIKLIYFSLPARAEVARLLLTLGGVEFEDHRMDRDEWQTIKPNTPFGQVPVLEVDGKYLAQSVAIDRYCAAKAGLLPSDPWAAALADQAYCYVEDVMKLFYATFTIKDADEKIKARQEVVAGPLKEKMGHLSKLLASKPGAFVAGDKISHGDLHLFCMLSTLRSGWLDGVPKDVLDAYPDIKAYRNTIANVPGVRDFYAKENDDIRLGFRAD